MEPEDRHLLAPDASFDGGSLHCGNGLVLLIRQHIDPLERGQLLEIRSTEISVDEGLPAWGWSSSLLFERRMVSASSAEMALCVCFRYRIGRAGLRNAPRSGGGTN